MSAALSPVYSHPKWWGSPEVPSQPRSPGMRSHGKPWDSRRGGPVSEETVSCSQELAPPEETAPSACLREARRGWRSSPAGRRLPPTHGHAISSWMPLSAKERAPGGFFLGWCLICSQRVSGQPRVGVCAPNPDPGPGWFRLGFVRVSHTELRLTDVYNTIPVLKITAEIKPGSLFLATPCPLLGPQEPDGRRGAGPLQRGPPHPPLRGHGLSGPPARLALPSPADTRVVVPRCP